MIRIFDFIVVSLLIYMAIAVYGKYMDYHQRHDSKQYSVENDYCDNIAALSETMMLARQEGLSINDVRNAYLKANQTEDINDIAEYILVKAYSYPIADNKDEMITSFRNIMEVSCMLALSEGE